MNRPKLSKDELTALLDELQALARAWHDRLDFDDHMSAGIFLMVGARLAFATKMPLDQVLTHVRAAHETYKKHATDRWPDVVCR